MIVNNFYLNTLLLLFISYLLGSFPPAFIAGKIRKIDIRYTGSKNVGVMNTFSSVGKWAGIMVIAADFGKGALSAFIAGKYSSHPFIPMLGVVAAMIGHNWMVLFALSILMYVGIEQGISFYVNTYIKSMTSSEIISSLALSGFWGFMVVGRIICSYISRKIDPKKLIVVLASFATISILLISLSRNYVLAAIGFSILGLGLSGIWPLLVYSSSAAFPRFAGTTIGIMMASSAIGGMVIPFASNAVGSLIGPSAGVGSLIIPAVVVIAVQLFIIRKALKPKP